VAYAAGQIIPAVYTGNVSSPANAPITASNVRIPSSNYVLQWSAAVITMVRSQNHPSNFGRSPLFNSTRVQALLHVAMHDTIQAYEKNYAQYQEGLPIPPFGSNIQAAIGGAAYTIFTYYFGDNVLEESKYIDILLFQQAILLSNGIRQSRISKGFIFGVEVAALLLTNRTNDGYNHITPFVPQTSNGFFRPTPPDFPSPVGNNWGAVTPWGLPNPIQFYFPPLGGNTYLTRNQTYIVDYLEVVGRGRDTQDFALSNVTRSDVETFIGIFFDNDLFGTTLPPGQYLTIAQSVGQQLNLDRGNFSRMLAYVGLTIANCNIGGWAVKYTFQEWRPVSAIRAGATDAFPQTIGDPNWLPVSVVSPAFPDYVSGHGTFGFGFAEIMTLFTGGDNFRFTIFSDSLPRISSSYERWSDFALDNALSRVFLGVHFRTAALDTQFVGQPIANDVFRLLKPL